MKQRGIPVIGMDYMFMTKKPDKEHLVYPIIVLKDSESGGIWAIPTSRKGLGGIRVVDRIVEIVNGLGYSKVVLKSDQEFFLKEVEIEVRKELWNETIEYQKKIKAIKEGGSAGGSTEAASSCGGMVLIENSPVGESQANGMVEKAVQDIQGFIRAAKFQLEKRTGDKITSGDTVWSWIIDYAAKVYRNFHVHGRDKKTTTQRIRDNVDVVPIAEFGESILWKPAKTVVVHKDGVRWRKGVWYGFPRGASIFPNFLNIEITHFVQSAHRTAFENSQIRSNNVLIPPFNEP